ncbi:MAG: hypothetical protein A2857_00915 [Candidatus Levybacteria bacterium RIFCSPHIGHO2_01_FULL_36_15]|nr:MAG: hypothetical protein A2857_00915 [Candidatus Levybacteria bacterium RIFCSPHIGHO2_01_FULL_36_15]OGH37286.1 MAG: hypothetical protein A2905_01115 [Candidatus Levybacteria bacterium RIFCSPLOWO2_01_FULL_36_10]
MPMVNLKRVLERINYCTICAEKFKNKKDSPIICSKCGYHHYLSPKPTNAAILQNKKREILFVRRKYPPKKNFWDLPGGFLNINETIEESMTRELEEELGVRIENIKYFISTYDSYLYKNVLLATICSIYQGEVVGKDFIPNDDVLSVKFFPKSKIPYLKIAFPSLVEVLKKFVMTG